jgi:hypothetical protein
MKNLRYAVCLVALLAVAGPGLYAEVRVTHADALKNVVKKAVPEYSPVGNAMLTGTVVKAVKEWKFTPFTEDGKPAPAVAQMKFNFKL